MNKTFEIKGLDDLAPLVNEILSQMTNHRIWLFYGEMGTGKTTTITSILKKMGIAEPEGSPTYGLVNTYDSTYGKVYHFDLYRLRSTEEAWDIGLTDLMDEGICFIEWPQLAEKMLPEEVAQINIRSNPDLSRTFELILPMHNQ